MATWEQEFSIAADTANGAVAGEKFYTEIDALSLGFAFEGHHSSGDALFLCFAGELNGADQTTVAAKVALHDGVPMPVKTRIEISGTVYEATSFLDGAITWTEVT